MKIKNKFFKNKITKLETFIHRITITCVIVAFLSIILIFNLYYLQYICFEHYNICSNKNYIRLIPIAPSRGIIYDSNGIAIALNRNVYQIELIPDQADHLKQSINELRKIVDLSDQDIVNFDKAQKYVGRFSSIPLKLNLNEVQQARFLINQFRFPGIFLKEYQQRYYPYHSLLTHVIGYVSKIDSYDIKKLNDIDILNNYVNTYDIGKLGVERYYENILHGKIGYKKVMINNHNQIIHKINEKLPESGKDIFLTIDVNLQKFIKSLLGNSRAAIIVMDPRNGKIKALVSNPSYDPNLFVNGISEKAYLNLLKNENLPLINRTIQGIYPPASTVKPYILVSAMHIGVIRKNFLLFDPGWWQLPGSKKRFHDWKSYGHGWTDINKAIEESVDTFFYKTAYDMGIDRLSEWMKKFGYGQYTGIDLPAEISGFMPNRDWKIKRYNTKWYNGDTISVGIGQGYWAATPIQMIKALMTLINNGSIQNPHVLDKIKENKKFKFYQQTESIQIGDPYSESWTIAKNGMFGVANHVHGTAYKDFFNTPYSVAAKSGTAQIFSLKKREKYNQDNVSKRLQDHKLMSAFAPYNRPTVAIIVVLENGGVNSSAISTITRKIFDYILLKNN